MGFRVIFVALFSLLFVFSAKAQSSQIIPIYTSKKLEKNTLKIYSDSGILSITAYKANVVKVSFGDSLAPINALINDNLNIRVTQNLDDIFFATDSLWVIVSKSDLSIKFLKKESEKFLVKNSSYFFGKKNQAISFSLDIDDKPFLLELDKIKSDFKTTGPHKTFKSKKKLCNPLLISQMGYAMVIENPTFNKITVRAVAKNTILFEGNNAGLKTFYFFSGNSSEINGNLMKLASHSR